jgi:hypothetical protein
MSIAPLRELSRPRGGEEAGSGVAHGKLTGLLSSTGHEVEIRM